MADTATPVKKTDAKAAADKKSVQDILGMDNPLSPDLSSLNFNPSLPSPDSPPKTLQDILGVKNPLSPDLSSLSFKPDLSKMSSGVQSQPSLTPEDLKQHVIHSLLAQDELKKPLDSTVPFHKSHPVLFTLLSLLPGFGQGYTGAYQRTQALKQRQFAEDQAARETHLRNMIDATKIMGGPDIKTLMAAQAMVEKIPPGPARTQMVNLLHSKNIPVFDPGTSPSEIIVDPASPGKPFTGPFKPGYQYEVTDPLTGKVTRTITPTPRVPGGLFGSGGATPLTPDSLSLLGMDWLVDGKLPYLGMGAAGGGRQQVINTGTKLARDMGLSNADVIALRAASASFKAGFSQSEKIRTVSSSFEKTIMKLQKKAIDAFNRYGKKYGLNQAQILNRLRNATINQLKGDPDLSELHGLLYDVALDTAKYQTGNVSTTGATVEASKRADAMYADFMTQNQLNGILRASREAVEARKKSMNEVHDSNINYIRGLASGKTKLVPGTVPPPTTPTGPSSSNAIGKAPAGMTDGSYMYKGVPVIVKNGVVYSSGGS